MRNDVRRRVRCSVAALAAVAALASISTAGAVQLQVFSVSPAFTPIALAGRTVTLKGVGFTASTLVAFDGVAAVTTTLVDSRTIVAEVPLSATAKICTITVTDPGTGADDFYPFHYTGPVYYVATTGNDANNNGTSPTTPYRTLAKAFATVSATTPTEVRLAAGRYVESQLGLPNATILSCGWAPGFATRDPDRQVSELDGNRNGWVIRTVGLAATGVIDGCTIRNGLRDGFGGGGIPTVADTPILNNNVIVGNMSTVQGGGIYWTASTSYGGRPTFSNNVIIGNRSFAKNGGGVLLYTNYNSQQPIRVNLTGNAIVGNRSFGGRGGGFSLSTSTYSGYNTGTIVAADNIIGWNRARTGAGFNFSLQTFGDSFNLNFNNNLVVSNAAVGAGGGLGLEGVGSVYGYVKNSTFASNSGGFNQGGGMVIQGSVNLAPPGLFTATDLILWGNVGGDASGQASDRLIYSDASPLPPGAGNISANPAFVNGPFGGHYLRQADPNLPDSPAANAGSTTAAGESANAVTTRSDQSIDSDVLDMGYHNPTGAADSATPIAFLRVDPAQGDFGGSAWTLVRGDGFDPGATVQFANVNATKVVYLGPTRLLAQPAAHAQGLVDVKVTNPDQTTITSTGAYRYLDEDPPTWVTTVGVVSSQTAVDCVRTVVLDWNDAVDSASPPVVYEVYRDVCTASTNNTVPCANFGYIPSATTFIGSTTETFYVDPNHVAGGQDPKYIYNIRARDSASPTTNKEWNFGKRVSLATKLTTDTTQPSPVGATLVFASGTNNVLDWAGGIGAVSYGVYRTTAASLYTNPGALTKLATLTTLNNDFNGDGVTDTRYTDSTVPTTGQVFFYKVSSIDICNVETTSELLP